MVSVSGRSRKAKSVKFNREEFLRMPGVKQSWACVKRMIDVYGMSSAEARTIMKGCFSKMDKAKFMTDDPYVRIMVNTTKSRMKKAATLEAAARKLQKTDTRKIGGTKRKASATTSGIKRKAHTVVRRSKCSKTAEPTISLGLLRDVAAMAKKYGTEEIRMGLKAYDDLVK